MAKLKNSSDEGSNPKISLDVIRHKEKIKAEVKKRISSLIMDQAMVTVDGAAKIKVRIRALREYQFTFKTPEDSGARPIPAENDSGPGADNQPRKTKEYDANFRMDELVDLMVEDLGLLDLLKSVEGERYAKKKVRPLGLRRSGSLSRLSRKHTAKRKIARERAAKKYGTRYQLSDYRYRHFQEIKDSDERAVIFLIRDTSASMNEQKSYLAKALYFCLVLYLRKAGYSRIDVRFIIHDESAEEISEEDFFKLRSDGGTAMSAGHKKAKGIIDKEYSPNEWDIFIWHASDGENSPQDNVHLAYLIEEMCQICRVICLTEIKSSSSPVSTAEEMKRLASRQENFIVTHLNNPDDVRESLKMFIEQANKRRANES